MDVFLDAYGPVTSPSVMFVSGVRTRQGPKRASNPRSPTSTQAVSGVTRSARARPLEPSGGHLRTGSMRAGTCLCQGVPANSSRQFEEVREFGATPGTTVWPSSPV
jgi:hypothetical protein